jgi:hypothetical protein
MFKSMLAVLLFAGLVCAEDKPIGTALPPVCGAAGAKFDVKTDSERHPLAEPEAGKALVYFLEDDSEFGSTPKPTTMASLDGQWIGATHGNSYFYFSVDPGEHHLCASWQTKVLLGQDLQTAAAHFEAAAGGVYYFQVKNKGGHYSAAGTSLKPLDSDEFLLLASTFSFSASHEKK